MNREKSFGRTGGVSVYTFQEHFDDDVLAFQYASGAKQLRGLTLLSWSGTGGGSIEVVIEVNNTDSGQLAKHFVRGQMDRKADGGTSARSTSRTTQINTDSSVKETGQRGRSPGKNTAAGSTNEGLLYNAIHSKNMEALRKILGGVVDRMQALRQWNTSMDYDHTMKELET